MSLETHELEKIFQASKYQRKELAQLILLSLDGESGGLGFYLSLLLPRSLFSQHFTVLYFSLVFCERPKLETCRHLNMSPN